MKGDFEKRVRESFARQGFMAHLRAELLEVGEGTCSIAVDFADELTQQHGFFHAGVVSTLADNAAGYAAYSMMEESSTVLTVEYKLNLLAPANGDRLVAKAQVLKSGKTLTVCRVDVMVLKDNQEKLCAAAQCTLMQLKGKPDDGMLKK